MRGAVPSVRHVFDTVVGWWVYGKIDRAVIPKMHVRVFVTIAAAGEYRFG
jgi:hypothetical protein